MNYSTATGSGNTRLNSQVGSDPYRPDIDWLDFRGVLQGQSALDLFEWVANETDDVIDWDSSRPGGRHVRFDDTVQSARGAVYAWQPEENGVKVWLSMPATALAGCDGLVGRLRLAGRIRAMGLRCSRLDLCLDDSTGKLSAVRDDIKSAFEVGHIAGFRTLTEVQKYEEPGAPAQRTQYVGSRESQSFVRIYDKEDRVRWERQMRGSVSDDVLADVLEVYSEAQWDSTWGERISKKIISHLTNGIDFIKKKDKNLDRGERLPFWSEFLQWLGEMQVKTTRKAEPFNIDRTMGWLDRQCSRTLAIVRRVAGFNYQEWMGNLLARGEKRITSSQERIIELLKENQRYAEQMRSLPEFV